MDAATQRTDLVLDAQAAFHAASCSVSGRTILSLFDYSGNWSLPYEEAGANVVRIDLKHGVDVMDISATWLMENVMDAYGTVDGIHSTDYGMRAYADAYEKVIREILR